MLSSTAFRSVFALALVLLVQLAAAAPGSTGYLSTGWSGHERRSTMDASITYAFNASSTAAAGCASACSLFAVYQSTCGLTLYAPECGMCSTAGLDAYVQCANCLVANVTVAVDHGALASTLSLMERVCTSYTRTALPSLTLNVQPSTSSSTSAGSPTVLARRPLAGALVVAAVLALGLF